MSNQTDRIGTNVIPTDWKIKPLEEVCENQGLVRGPFGGSLKKECFTRNGYKIYEQKNAIYKDAEIGSYYVNEQKFNELKRFEIRESDFIVSCSGTIGRIFRLPENSKPGIINQALLKIKINPKILDSYFFYKYFEWNKFQNSIIDNTQGGAMQNLVGMELFRRTLIPIPPLPEQHAIAEALSDVDTLISSLDALIAKKRAIKQGVMQELLTGKRRLPRFTDAWKIYKLEDVANKNIKWSFTGGPFGSNLKSSEYSSTGVRIIQLQNIGDGVFHNDYAIYTTDEKANELISCNIFPGEIILSKMGDPVARACLIPFQDSRYLMASDGIRLAVNEKQFDKYFVLYSINFDEFRKKAIEASTGTTRQRIGLDKLRNIQISMPGKPEQTAIAEIIKDIDSEITILEQKRDKTKSLKQGMMQELLTGRIQLIKE